jgi:hypothetical protein
MNIKIGFSQIKKEVPAVVGWVVGSSAAVMTALAALNAIYPAIITEHIVAEAGKLLGAIGIISPFFGVKKTTETTITETNATGQ